MAQTGQEDSLRAKKVWTFVSQLPVFPGGEDGLKNFIKNNLKYPTLAKEKGIEGRVIVTFVVNIDGSVSDIEILRDLGNGCSDAAIAMVKQMPLWKPAIRDGVAVRFQYNLPVTFQLQ